MELGLSRFLKIKVWGRRRELPVFGNTLVCGGGVTGKTDVDGTWTWDWVTHLVRRFLIPFINLQRPPFSTATRDRSPSPLHIVTLGTVHLPGEIMYWNQSATCDMTCAWRAVSRIGHERNSIPTRARGCRIPAERLVRQDTTPKCHATVWPTTRQRENVGGG